MVACRKCAVRVHTRYEEGCPRAMSCFVVVPKVGPPLNWDQLISYLSLHVCLVLTAVQWVGLTFFYPLPWAYKQSCCCLVLLPSFVVYPMHPPSCSNINFGVGHSQLTQRKKKLVPQYRVEGISVRLTKNSTKKGSHLQQYEHTYQVRINNENIYTWYIYTWYIYIYIYYIYMNTGT